ncbi:ABC transporter ATP-binding protein [Oceanobacillus senegalensis]|uniref:ABC transporter ATP-binding protein n=1 Tax=Oceanobacillus senegalensis TaxID=1936063 RepID=UPI000A311866|nr:sn-glycerol-3-phosphate ABC transporter ATP-binding protein UgpC [Oceanobacillus senegalensis]
MAKLLLENIKKVYNKNVIAVDKFNLHIQEGEFIVLVGPSGCGKSTTLRMIAGLEEITDGELYIDDVRMNHVSAKDRDIAMVFQNYALYPHMTVYDNLAFGLRLRKISQHQIDLQVQQTAAILNIESLLNRKPKALSGGQRQRVALGRAIVRNPRVYLMDEPLSNLDAKLRIQMRAEIQKLHERLQTTTIYVTHDQTEAMTMASRLVVMKDGVIQQIGKPKDVYDYPENIFVAGFIGSPSMNFMKGKIMNNFFQTNHDLIELPRPIIHSLHEKGYGNKEVILGIRPEDIVQNIASTGNSYSTTINKVELLGGFSNIYFKLGDQEFIAIMDSALNKRAGDNIKLTFNMGKLHFFDSNTKSRIKMK